MRKAADDDVEPGVEVGMGWEWSAGGELVMKRGKG